MTIRTIFGGNKSAEELLGQLLMAPSNQNVMVTKLPFDVFNQVEWGSKRIINQAGAIHTVDPTEETLVYCRSSQTAFIRRTIDNSGLSVAITSAGVADIDVVDEAFITVMLNGHEPIAFHDIGVNDIPKLMSHIDAIAECHAVVSVQGFEGALPVVLAGLISVPIVAVPTSTGYGVSSDGLTALNTALTSCNSGIAVVNIDNGFGGASMAIRILDQIEQAIQRHSEIEQLVG